MAKYYTIFLLKVAIQRDDLCRVTDFMIKKNSY